MGDILKAAAAAIDRKRLEMGISVQELADKVGIDPDIVVKISLAEWEDFDLVTLQKFALAFGVDPQELLRV